MGSWYTQDVPENDARYRGNWLSSKPLPAASRKAMLGRDLQTPARSRVPAETTEKQLSHFWLTTYIN